MDSIFHYLYEAKPYKDEVCLNWTSSNSSYATYSSLSVLHGPSTYVNKIRPDSNNSKNPYIKVSCFHLFEANSVISAKRTRPKPFHRGILTTVEALLTL